MHENVPCSHARATNGLPTGKNRAVWRGRASDLQSTRPADAEFPKGYACKALDNLGLGLLNANVMKSPSMMIRVATLTSTFVFAASAYAQTDPAPSAIPEAVAPSSGAEESSAAEAHSAIDAAEHARPNFSRPWFRVRAVAELGFLAVLSHKIQFGKDGTYFDYVKDGAQDNLFAVTRASVEVELKRRHTFVFLYQPLDIVTKVALPRAVRIAGADFAEGTPVQLRYGFPFYRGSYLYDFVKSPKHELSFGLGLQIRNATIDFESQDGTVFTSNRDIGPVPLLKSRGRYSFKRGAFVGYEVDGLYAPVSVINGSDNEVTGAIIDLSLRGGLSTRGHSDVFLNLRYLGGGAVGQSDPKPTYDGYTKNWLHFMTVSIGASLGTF